MWKWLLAVLKAFVLCFQETLKVKVKKTEDLGQPEVTGFQDDSIMQFFYWIKSVPFFQCTPLCDSGKIQFYRNGTNCPIISKLFKAYICSVLMISIHLWVKVHISDWRCFLNINFYYVKWMFLQLLQCKQKIFFFFLSKCTGKTVSKFYSVIIQAILLRIGRALMAIIVNRTENNGWVW